MILTMLQSLRSWWRAHKRRPLSELLAVDFDSEGVRVRVLDQLELAWNQEFRWSEVVRVCFKDEGIYQSDVVFVTVKGRDKPVAVLMEAEGADTFFGQLTERGLFPMEIARKAIGSSSGGMFCWPEH